VWVWRTGNGFARTTPSPSSPAQRQRNEGKWEQDSIKPEHMLLMTLKRSGLELLLKRFNIYCATLHNQVFIYA